MKKHILGIVGGMAMAVSTSAQQLPVMNHYIYNPYLINPARTGQNEYGTINVNFKKQWVSLPYSPLTAILSGEGSLRNTKIGNMGLGGMIYTDHTHLINKVGGLASYAYHIQLEKAKTYAHQLSIGLSMGVINQRLNYTEATVGNEADIQVLANAANGTSFDFSLGLDYQWRNLHVGFSMLQGLNNGLKFINPTGNEIKYVNSRHFTMLASYRFLLKPVEKKHRFFIEPVFMGRIVPNIPFQAEGNLLFGMDGIAWLGLGYRSSNIETATSAINVTVGGEVLRRFVFAYSFEVGVDGQLNASMGTQHEFTLSYRIFGKNKKQEEQMKQMSEQLEQLKQDNATVSKKLEETQTTLTRHQMVIDSLKAEMQKAEGDKKAMQELQQKMDQQIKSQQELLDKHEQRIDAHDEDIDQLRKAIQQNPLQYKKLGEVYFQTGSSALDATANSNLDAVVGALNAKPNAKIYLYGHASTDGNAKTNMELSVKRASGVRQYLISKGIPAERIEMLPFGAENPVSGNTKVNDMDRRVEIIISESDGKGKL